MGNYFWLYWTRLTSFSLKMKITITFMESKKFIEKYPRVRGLSSNLLKKKKR